MTTPYFCRVIDDRYFSFAETKDGPTLNLFLNKAKELNVYIIGTWFEKEKLAKTGVDRYFNSAFLCSPEGGLVGIYRKTHIPKIVRKDLFLDEKYYFEKGDSLETFNVKGVEVGILICYDRSFPEAFRTLWLKGAKIIFIPIASLGTREKFFIHELQIRAVENHLFIVAVNKAGDEIVEHEEKPRHHFGKSCVIDPFGTILVELDDKPFSLFHATVDLMTIEEADASIPWKRDRRPELYGRISDR